MSIRLSQRETAVGQRALRLRSFVIPAEAGIQVWGGWGQGSTADRHTPHLWIPASAGMTGSGIHDLFHGIAGSRIPTPDCTERAAQTVQTICGFLRMDILQEQLVGDLEADALLARALVGDPGGYVLKAEPRLRGRCRRRRIG